MFRKKNLILKLESFLLTKNACLGFGVQVFQPLSHFSCQEPKHIHHTLYTVQSTGRQPPPLYSVLYGTGYSNSKRNYVLPRNCSVEKNQVPRELALKAISLACLVAQFIWWKLKMSYSTILPILIGIVHIQN
jgi:hypothetical protein